MSEFRLHSDTESVSGIGNFSGVDDILFQRKHGAVVHNAGEARLDSAHDVIKVTAVVEMQTYGYGNFLRQTFYHCGEALGISPVESGVMFRVKHTDNRFADFFCSLHGGVDHVVVERVKGDHGCVCIRCHF